MTSSEAKDRIRAALGRWESKNLPNYEVVRHGDPRDETKQHVTSVTLRIPIETVTEGNSKETIFTKSARAKKQRAAVAWAVVAAKSDWRQLLHLRKWLVTLTRYSAGTLDAHDNLRSALKHVVDQVTEELGLSSDSDARIEFEYEQRIVPRGERWVFVKVEKMREVEEPFDADDYNGRRNE